MADESSGNQGPLIRTPQEKFALLFEAAKRSLVASGKLLTRLAEDLVALESDFIRGIEIQELAVSPLLSVVAFIDFAHRFGSIVDALPLLKKRAPQLRQLRSALAPVEAARNHLQHMRGDLTSNAHIDYPVLGSLAWTNERTCYLLAFSQPTNAKHYSIVYDAHNQCWAAKHQYRVKDVTISLDSVLTEMRVAYEWITSVVEFSNSDFADLRWGKTQLMAFHISVNENAPKPDDGFAQLTKASST
jgi:hypothetical protein